MTEGKRSERNAGMKDNLTVGKRKQIPQPQKARVRDDRERKVKALA